MKFANNLIFKTILVLQCFTVIGCGDRLSLFNSRKRRKTGSEKNHISSNNQNKKRKRLNIYNNKKNTNNSLGYLEMCNNFNCKTNDSNYKVKFNNTNPQQRGNIINPYVAWWLLLVV